MCGIFGMVISPGQAEKNSSRYKRMVIDLLKLSQQRGKDASGIALATANQISVLKRHIKASELYKSEEYQKLISSAFRHPAGNNSYIVLMGHARMMTDGSAGIHYNNQPVIKSNRVVVHNGIIVNHSILWNQYSQLKKEFETDTEIIPALIDLYEREGLNLPDAFQRLYREIKGAASVAMISADNHWLCLASNTGSLYVGQNNTPGFIAFASEKNMLKKACVDKGLFAEKDIQKINSQKFAFIDLTVPLLFFFNPSESHFHEFEICKTSSRLIIDICKPGTSGNMPDIILPQAHSTRLERLLEDNSDRIKNLKRCSRCLLPETFPGIDYDEHGVCMICRRWVPIHFRGIEKLAEQIKNSGKEPENTSVLVPLSGGRDSSFALHYLKQEMGMNPIAFTYDWGMVTDLARRNISRITGELGIEHILISADIYRKRAYIRKNIEAWLKRPSLGTVPLFMAGDKQLFYYANQLKKQLDTDLLIFAMNPLERTDFKVAFTGITEKKKEKRHYHLSASNKIRLALFYLREYFLNPAYINTSIFDTISAFLSYYFIPHQYMIFYEYFPWNEKLIKETLIDKYDWECAPDTPTTWRIGDGTAAFYNYIYYTVAGFTENDTFRSNQIRQGLITRQEAEVIVAEENKPRYESIKWYLDIIGMDFERVIITINKMKKLYA